MTPTIRIDHEVYEKLQEQAKPFVDTPNAVLRRLLELPEAPEPRGKGRRHGHGRRGPEGHGPRGRRNRLALLLEAGVLEAGDELVWARPRSGEEYVATLTEDGQIQLEDGTLHDSPSGAGKALNGYDANGWINWRIHKSGLSLREALGEIRDEKSDRPRRPRRGHGRGRGPGAPRRTPDEA
ncbi:hypothetical protein [Nocardioides sp. AE5]|uniref:restriction system modified-DNA reader domain-containing protein n=1 Tax=Nocardioides sp. AE5 TaxID=2962573 RepID=UPI002880F044|nr:hypothetical protein [Nocardioides sp. AE5]MDT0203971.1 hypothetical protein [Nocardioides sp. AE5]